MELDVAAMAEKLVKLRWKHTQEEVKKELDIRKSALQSIIRDAYRSFFKIEKSTKRDLKKA